MQLSSRKVMDKTRRQRRERGSVIIISTFGMLAFLLATGLCVDISHFYLVKTELQNAADAAALAGASALNSSSTGISEARRRAVVAMNSYEFNQTGLTIPNSNVQFAINLNGPYLSEADAQAQAATIRFVKVTTPSAATRVFFASMVLGGTRDLSAEATAGMSVPTNVFCNWLPVSVIDYDNATILPGNVYTIRAAPQNSVSPGNYQVLAVAGRGGADVRVGLASGVDECAEAGATYNIDTKPGVNSGPVRQGINTRFDDYQGGVVDPTNEPPDTNVKENITYAQYRDGTATQAPNHPGVPGRRVVVIPIIKQSEFDQGRNTVKFNRFGVFFLQSKVSNGNGGDIQAEYINDIVVAGSGGFDPNGGAANNLLVVPVLYR